MQNKKYALLVIDMNLGLFDPKSRGGILYRAREYLVPCINSLVNAFRARGLPVIWITQRYSHDLSDAPLLLRKSGDRTFALGVGGWKLLPEFEVQLGDLFFIKPRYSAFFDTGLHHELQQMRVTSLVIAGVNTHACIRATTLDAYQYDYDPIIWPKNGIASSLPQFGQNTIRYMIGDTPGLGIVEGLLFNEEIISRL